MKRLVICILLALWFIGSTTMAFELNAKKRLRTSQGSLYVPGELLVKYKPSVRAAASEYYRTQWGISNLRTFKTIGVQHVKLPKDMTVEQALEVYKNDPDVEYAEPNYYRYPMATPNDTYFDQLWGLHNTGQNVYGTSGTIDADIDAPEAWDLTTGSSDVVIAVIDSGVDYNHPDLSDNIWSNTGEIPANGIDDDNNGYVDDVQGWDFVDDDNDPIDSYDHGTHVAGTIAAKGNNGAGVVGVCWTAKIMPLRTFNAFGTVADGIEAIDYAINNGAMIINASYGSYTYSISEYNAISRAKDAGILFVAAAGNYGTDNDTNPVYPSSYSLDNIIAVAATDQNDNLAYFSNYGLTSVDVGAPGTIISSAKPARQTVWSDNFDDGDANDWLTGGTSYWGFSSISCSGLYSLTDSPGVNYQNNTSSWLMAPVLNLSSYSGAKLEFKLRGISEYGYDFLYFQVSTNGISWADQVVWICINNELERFDNGISGSLFSGGWFDASVDLGAYDLNSPVYIRFLFTSDNSLTYDGWYIDDIKVTTASSSYSGTEYQYLQGTSMATPHVAGVAGLILSYNPNLSYLEVKNAILNSVDKLDSLKEKVLTGGRVNACNALPPVAPSNLSATAASTSQINMTWTDNSSNESGFKIERKTESGESQSQSETVRATQSGGTYTQIATVGANVTTYNDTGLSAGTTYYYRVCAYNSTGDSSYSNEVNATTTSASAGGGGGGGGCFIATAAYGSHMVEEVIALTQFRDNILMKCSLGKHFVRFYYEISPPLADYIRENEILRTATRLALIPIVYGVKYPKASVLTFLCSVMAIALTLRVRRSNRF